MGFLDRIRPAAVRDGHCVAESFDFRTVLAKFFYDTGASLVVEASGCFESSLRGLCPLSRYSRSKGLKFIMNS